MTRPRPHLERHMPQRSNQPADTLPRFLLLPASPFPSRFKSLHGQSFRMCDQYHFDQWGQEPEDAGVRRTRGEREYLPSEQTPRDK